MAQRVYRHDLRCPHCGSNWLPKYGCSRGKQTYVVVIVNINEIVTTTQRNQEAGSEHVW